MNITVIGGSGFVGSRLIKELDKSKVENIDKNQSPFYQSITKIGDIRNIDQIEINPKTNCIVLLAAEHRDDVSPKSLYYDVNVQGTLNVLKKMDELNIKNLVFTSSVAIYGLNKKNPDENHNEDPFNHYGKSKWKAEKIIDEWYKKNPNSKSVTIIRPTVIFGERNRGNVYNLLKQINSGKFLMIGKGKNKKSMAYVGNVVEFIKLKIFKTENGFNVYNYSDKPDYSMIDLVNLIQKNKNFKLKVPYFFGILIGYFFDFLSFILRKKLLVSSVRIKKFCSTTQFDSKKAHKIFTPTLTLDEGLSKTIEYEFGKASNDDVVFFSE